MRYKSFLSLLIIPAFLLVQGCGNFSDNRTETSNEKNTLSGSSSDSNRLSSRVIDELQTNLTSTSSSRISRVSSRSSSKVLSNSLTSSQINQITTAATQAVSDAGFTSSEDLIQLMPKIIEGSQSKLSSIGISSSEETIKVINVIVNSMVKSVNARSQYLQSSSAESGATPTETIFKKITSTSVSKLDEAGLSASDIGAASSELVGTVVGSLGSAGISSSDVGGALDKITAGAVDSLDEISGFDVNSLGAAIDNITGGATAALGDIEITGFSSDNLSAMVEKVTSGATTALGNISMAGYSSDNLSSMVEMVTSGATGALGKIQMSGYDSADLTSMVEKVTAGATVALGKIEMAGYDAGDLSGMMEKVTAGATKALGRIEMTGYDAADLSGLVEKVTAGATAAVGKISMSGFSSDNLTSMVEKVTAGATQALGDIKMTGFSADNLTSMVEKVTAGATGALGKIEMTGYDAADLSGMMEKITAGATASLGKIKMEGYDSTKLSGMMEKVTAGATAALGNIEMTGFSADNLTSMVEKVTAGATEALGEIQMDGFSADNLTLMVEKVTAGATSSLGKIQMTGYDSTKLTGMIEKVTAGATGALGNIKMSGFEAGDLSGMVEKISAGATSALGEIKMTGYDSNDLSAMVEKLTSGTTGALGKIQMDGFSADNLSSLESSISSSTTTALGQIQMDGFDPNNIPSDLTNSINTGVTSGQQKQPPILKEVVAVSSPTTDTTPSYTFNSSKAGAITYEGSCKSSTTSASSGNNKVTFNTLEGGTYNDCKIRVTDNKSNVSTPLRVSGFRIITDSDPNALVGVWGGTQQIGTSLDDYPSAMTIDASENIFLVGTTIGSLAQNNNGDNDTFLIKLNKSGIKQWVKQEGTPGTDRGWGVATDSSGAVFITGYTEDSLHDNINLGFYDIFLSKYDSNGNRQWTQQFGTSKNDYGSRLVIDHNNNIFLIGETFGALDGQSNYGGYDAFVMKFNSSGVRQWTQQFGTSENDVVWGSDTDSKGNIYITGYSEGGLDGNTNSGGRDFFLFKYNMNGTNSSVRILGSSSDDIGYGVSVDSDDNIYLIADTEGSIDGFLNSGNSDVFLAKYNTSLDKIWSLQMGTSNHDVPQALEVDSQNNIYVTGYTYGGIDNYKNLGDTDIFLIKFNPSGEKVWSRQLGTNSFDVAEAISIDSENNILVSGYTRGGLEHNTNFGERDIFLLRFDSNGNLQTGDISIIDNIPPSVSLVTSSNSEGKYKLGDNISINVTFNEPVFIKDNQLEKIWTSQLGGSANEFAHGVSVAPDGNIFVTGTTYGDLDGNTKSGYNFDIFLSKFDSNGGKQWTRQLGIQGDLSSQYSKYAEGYDVANDSKNNTYITGYNEHNNSGNGYDTFLIKYSPDGQIIWTKKLITSEGDLGHGLDVDNLDNIFVTGSTGGGLDGSSDARGIEDLFLTKFNSDGTIIWTKQIGTSEWKYTKGYDLSIDSSGNIYVTGYTEGALDGHSKIGDKDIVLVKFNTNGDIIWTNQIGTIYDDIPQSVTLDTHNNIYVTGSTRGSLDGSSRSSFDRDVFLSKFNDNGSLIWSKQFGINGDEIGYSIAIDNENQIYITGKAGNNLDGKGTATGREFIVKYLPDGTQDWLKQLGNIGSSMGISVNNLGELVVAGSVSGDLNGNKNAGGEDFFVMKFATGPPSIELETGETDRRAIYSFGNNTKTLTFNYTVQPHDNTSDLNYTSTSAIKLNSGSIQDKGFNLADLTLPSLESSASLGGSKNIVVDGIRPISISWISFENLKVTQNNSFNKANAAGTLVIKVPLSEQIGVTKIYSNMVVKNSTNSNTVNVTPSTILPKSIKTDEEYIYYQIDFTANNVTLEAGKNLFDVIITIGGQSKQVEMGSVSYDACVDANTMCLKLTWSDGSDPDLHSIYWPNWGYTETLGTGNAFDDQNHVYGHPSYQKWLLTGDKVHLEDATTLPTLINASNQTVFTIDAGANTLFLPGSDLADVSISTPVLLSSDGTLPGGLKAGTTYYLHGIDNVNKIVQLATNSLNAMQGTVVNLTTDQGSGIHTLTALGAETQVWSTNNGKVGDGTYLVWVEDVSNADLQGVRVELSGPGLNQSIINGPFRFKDLDDGETEAQNLTEPYQQHVFLIQVQNGSIVRSDKIPVGSTVDALRNGLNAEIGNLPASLF